MKKGTRIGRCARWILGLALALACQVPASAQTISGEWNTSAAINGCFYQGTMMLQQTGLGVTGSASVYLTSGTFCLPSLQGTISGGLDSYLGISFSLSVYQFSGTISSNLRSMSGTFTDGFSNGTWSATLAHFCGDGNVTGTEQCDDGNVEGGDCCSPTCQWEPTGSACGSGNSCMNDLCCNPSTTLCPFPGCNSVPAGDGTPCSDGTFCNGPEACQGGACLPYAISGDEPCQLNCIESTDQCGCPSAAVAGCRSAEKSILVLKNNVDDSKDVLRWKWIRGPYGDVNDFGDPIYGAHYWVCLYSGTGALISGGQTDVLPGQGWQEAFDFNGYKFRGGSDGIRAMTLKGTSQNLATILVRGKGNGLGEPSLPIPAGDLPLRVQLFNDEAHVCWESSFDSADILNNGTIGGNGQFKARAR